MTRLPVSGSRTFLLRFQTICPTYNGLQMIPRVLFGAPTISYYLSYPDRHERRVLRLPAVRTSGRIWAARNEGPPKNSLRHSCTP